MSTVTYQSVKLAQWFDEPDIPTTGQARLFGELVKLATPIVEMYHSDLYHDANYIRENVVTHGDWFYYCIDDYGTHIGQYEAILEHRKTAQYLVTLRHESQVWYATIERIN